jgi:hypothetical protein
MRRLLLEYPEEYYYQKPFSGYGKNIGPRRKNRGI